MLCTFYINGGEAASILLCKANYHIFRQLISEFRIKLRTVFGDSMSSIHVFSILKESSIILIVHIGDQQLSPYEKLSNAEVSNGMCLGGSLVSQLQ